MPLDLRLLRAQDSTIQFIVHSLNHSARETSLKIQTRTMNGLNRSRRLSTREELKKLYNIEYGKQPAQSSQIHGRCETTCTIVLRGFQSSGRSFPESHKMIEICEHYQTFQYQFMQTWQCFTFLHCRLLPLGFLTRQKGF